MVKEIRAYKGAQIECVRRATALDQGIFKVILPPHLQLDKGDVELVCLGIDSAYRRIDERVRNRTWRRRQVKPFELPRYLKTAL